MFSQLAHHDIQLERQPVQKRKTVPVFIVITHFCNIVSVTIFFLKEVPSELCDAASF